MWWLANIALLLIGSILTYRGWRLGQQTDAYDALWLIANGLALLAVGIVSSAVKSVWF